MICRYVALFVPDLRAAEAFYRHVFDMELLFREGSRGGREYVLPEGREWDDLEAGVVTIDMLALEGHGFVLALFPGTPQPGTVLELGIEASPEDIGAMRARLPQELVREHEEGFLHFDDPFGFRWTVMELGTPFVSVLPVLPPE